jgi:hypothetical protein
MIRLAIQEIEGL